MSIEFRTPPKASGNGAGEKKYIKVADLLDKLVAIHVGSMGTIETKLGSAFRVEGDTYIMDIIKQEITPCGNLSYFQQILAEKLSNIGTGEWMLAYVRKGERAYFFDAPDTPQLQAATKLAEHLPKIDPLEDY